MQLMQKLRSFCRGFLSSAKGNVAVIFGVSAIPVMVLIGGAVDYAQAIKVKSQVISTLDAAMLAAMNRYAVDNDVDYKAIIEDYIDSNYTNSAKNLRGVIVDVDTQDVAADGEMITTVEVHVPTYFFPLAAFYSSASNLNSINFHLQSAAMVGGSHLEVALVLDNTGSMCPEDDCTKINDLEAAATNLVSILVPDGDNEKIKIGIVPFADYVNIGEPQGSGSFGNDTWDVVGSDSRSDEVFDIPDDFKHTKPGTRQVCPDPAVNEHCTGSTWDPTPGCGGEGSSGCWRGGTCTCDVPKVDAPYEEQDWKWTGCMASRPHDLNVRDDGYDTGIPGQMLNWHRCSRIAPVTPLTSTKSDILDALGNMKHRGETYIPAGLSWGWRLLSPEAPFSEGKAYSDEATKKVIVLMTDGANSRSTRQWGRWPGWPAALYHEGEFWAHDEDGNNAEQQANDLTEELCTNIREKGIIVYTIGFEIEPDSDIENLMKGCASNGGKYFGADNGAALNQAFEEIGVSLQNLRLSR